MLKLEADQAARYYDRLLPLVDDNTSRENYLTQGQLLQAILRLDSVYVRTKRTEIMVTANGFPSFALSLPHVNHAIKLHFERIEQKRRAAGHWLEAIINASSDQIAQTDKKIQLQESQYPEIGLVLGRLSSDSIDYLQAISDGGENSSRLPLFTDSKQPGLLLSRIANTPFARLSETQIKNLRQSSSPIFFRKYIDSQGAFRDLVLGDPKSPVKPDDLPKHPRFPILITGELTSKGKANVNMVSTEDLTAYITQERYSSDPDRNNRKLVTVVEQKPVKPRTYSQTRNMMGLDHGLREAYLNLDLSHLGDESVDMIMDNLPKLEDQVHQIANLARSVARNSPTKAAERAKITRDFLATLEAIDDIPARQAFQLAVARSLAETKDEILKPPPTSSRDGQTETGLGGFFRRLTPGR